MIHWAVVNENGQLEGEHSALHFSSIGEKAYNEYTPPQGYSKVLLSIVEYQDISDSFDQDKRAYLKKVDLITSEIISLTIEEIQAAADLNRIRELSMRGKRTQGKLQAEADVPLTPEEIQEVNQAIAKMKQKKGGIDVK